MTDSLSYLDHLGVTQWRLRNETKQTSTITSASAQIMVSAVEPASPTIANADWPTLASMVKACTQCNLCQTRRNTVFGTGNRQADLLVIGEAPGATEDAQGEPFVGQAGQLLDKMLAAIQLSREIVYIANVIKCRPPQNRDPLPTEIQHCAPYLERQIALLQPKLILVLGRVAAQALLSTTTPLNKLRGQTFALGNTQIPVIVTYHPAYLLRNPADKRNAYQDLLRTQALLQSLQSPSPA